MYVSSRGSSHNLKKALPLHRSNPYQRTHPLAHTHTYLRAIAGVRKRRRALALLTFRLLAGAKLDARARACSRRKSERVGWYIPIPILAKYIHAACVSRAQTTRRAVPLSCVRGHIIYIYTHRATAHSSSAPPSPLPRVDPRCQYSRLTRVRAITVIGPQDCV